MMAWVAERVAEQRLLWNLRGHDAAMVTATPTTCRSTQVLPIVRQSLRADHDRHRRWLVVDTVLLVGSGVLALRPGPERHRLLLRLPRGRPLAVDARRARRGCDRRRGAGAPSPALTRAARRRCARPAARARRAPSTASRGSSACSASSTFIERLRRSLAERLKPATPTRRWSLPVTIGLHVKLRDLAARLDCRLDGDGDVEIVARGRHPRRRARRRDVRRQSRNTRRRSPRTRASAVILRDDGPAAPCAVLRSADPYLAFARAVGAVRARRSAGAGRARDGGDRRRRPARAPACRSARSSSSAPARRLATAR